MRDRSHDTAEIDELDLAIETLKDLTPLSAEAEAIRGGVTSGVKGCYCGTM